MKGVGTGEYRIHVQKRDRSIKKYLCRGYVTSSGAMLKQRHVNIQKDDFSSVLQQNVSTKLRFHKICLHKNRYGC